MNQGRALWAEEKYFEINSPTNSMIGPKEMSKELHSVSFSPVLSDSPKILILGTIPGKESLKKKQYYSNSRNSFWKILFELLKVEKSLGCSYEEKIEILKQNNISLWDICHSGIRKSSLDSDIKEEIPNDIPQFLSDNPTIEIVAFNGQKSEKLHKKYHKNHKDVKYLTLHSTSPANTIYTFEKKLENCGQLFENQKRERMKLKLRGRKR
jgi:hypoxanthine-DNA glycosylase